ncbi:DNA-directed RNA polymerases II subunit [Trypanosoma brucei equiperdum]|uniref:DNA-directed RNA polymerases II subunit n=1 Tax=Trypanosoma brucei equiperdum TaxID=630700 RepID=A0A3L6LB33_9TRYP|nr:DNA-directed RNA polymerases II subunit [Trypanosoma brucei equiperdum]
MSSERYVDGDLGEPFNSAEPLTLPVVVQLLRGRRDTSLDHPASRLIEKTCRQVELMQETCADECRVQRVMETRLRLVNKNNRQQMNAHLGNFVVGEDGFATLPPESDDFLDTAEEEAMKMFEAVALGTLQPKTADEARELIPSLGRFEPADLNKVLEMLDSL